MTHEKDLSYVPVGDHLLPGIRLQDEGDAPPVGRYGKLRQAFLREHCPVLYGSLLLSERLFPHLREVDAIAEARRASGCPERVIMTEIIHER